jgi:glycosyltransferase involved in cell wall biosynthesis
MLVLPSLTEGLPNVMLEAMACGTPVLASPVGAIPDVLKNESTGFILDSTEPSFLAKAILRVLENPTVSENVSTAASNYVRDNFDLRKTRLSWKALIGT